MPVHGHTKEKPTIEPTVHGMTEQEIRHKIDEALAKYKVADSAEKEELKGKISRLEDYVAQLEKAKEEQDKVRASDTTMVLPPNDIPPQQPRPAPEEPPVAGETPKRSRWKSLW